jgi:hypothetical protein
MGDDDDTVPATASEVAAALKDGDIDALVELVKMLQEKLATERWGRVVVFRVGGENHASGRSRRGDRESRASRHSRNGQCARQGDNIAACDDRSGAACARGMGSVEPDHSPISEPEGEVEELLDVLLSYIEYGC